MTSTHKSIRGISGKRWLEQWGHIEWMGKTVECSVLFEYGGVDRDETSIARLAACL